MKYAFVTGSSRGIGFSIGLALLEKGYKVVFNYVNSKTFTDRIDKKYTEDKDFFAIQYDNSNLREIPSLIDQLKQISHSYEIIVLNAGITDRSPFFEAQDENILNVFNCNLLFPTLFLNHSKDLLVNNGNIILIGSMLAVYPHATSIPYGVSKAGINALTKNMVKILEPLGVRINCINPGYIDTDWQKAKKHEVREAIKPGIALKRFGEPEEVAKLAMHIIENGYLNGSILQIDGGYSFKA
ncbi:short-chain dehydrogenase/reductase SDR [Pseudopedobacter saltans DSM 12145]|uniref:Short-chain dehydrogenase/reductase SDR n=1 Tax=Pseudopedobacter saltans (strain ATCC 51119 / DSM 12145 / JCM 21818 / CCUG 39354 / LMG 10337 / NBRC 100064 / NCIMB 13643) TaxID=762903 RepID=F0S6A4_PSESL|nr:SDR family oxidoreductase [Pseudopedobacter saltans]ADY53218.1 short-chain dehydrogenase/reductase SDR [Pseudopedobacter saltans DSM 12145]